MPPQLETWGGESPPRPPRFLRLCPSYTNLLKYVAIIATYLSKFVSKVMTLVNLQEHQLVSMILNLQVLLWLLPIWIQLIIGLLLCSGIDPHSISNEQKLRINCSI